MNRRSFLASAASAGIATVVPQSAFSAADRVVLGVMGVRGRGKGLAQSFAALPDVRVKYVCDVDSRVLPAAVAGVAERQKLEPKAVADFRRILDDPEVDALVVATPDHWHALATIHACMAGKDVYVEKPCSHNVLEGQRMVLAARRYNRIVQVGTQRRSSPDFQEAVALLRSGKIGKLRLAKAINCQRRANIGRKYDSPAPDGVDYDMWLGPATKRPFNENRFHYNWHRHWDTGTGDLGNDGSHHVDVARWGMGVSTPTKVTASGAKIHFDDDQQTPDTQMVTYQFNGSQIVYEMRLWSPYGEHGFENGNVFYGEAGYMVLGDSGWKVYDNANKMVDERSFRTRGDTEHLQNFLDCVRSRAKPNCDIVEGARSAAMCHLGNAACRLEKTLYVEDTEGTVRDPFAGRILKGSYREPWTLPSMERAR